MFSHDHKVNVWWISKYVKVKSGQNPEFTKKDLVLTKTLVENSKAICMECSFFCFVFVLKDVVVA